RNLKRSIDKNSQTLLAKSSNFQILDLIDETITTVIEDETVIKNNIIATDLKDKPIEISYQTKIDFEDSRNELKSCYNNKSDEAKCSAKINNNIL
ncbi:23551_t:CDS:2, partial [Racocetra persica]